MSILDSISKAANKWLDKLEAQFPEYVIEQKINQKKEEWKNHQKTANTISEQREKLQAEHQEAIAEKEELRLLIENRQTSEDKDQEHLSALEELITELDGEIQRVTTLEDENQQALEQCAKELQELQQAKLISAGQKPHTPLDNARAKLEKLRGKTATKSPAERAKERLKQLKKERLDGKENDEAPSSETKMKKTL